MPARSDSQKPIRRDDNRTRVGLGEKLEVTIEKFIWGGPGLARTEHGVVFVDFSAPGDRLLVEISEVAKDYSRARIVEIIEPSSLRQPAPCPVFGRCGGCDWQHLSIDNQISAKEELLAELFQRQLKHADILPVIRSPKAWNYRNRIQIHVDQFGPYYHGKRSHDPVYIKDCPIADESLNHQLRALKAIDKQQAPLRTQLALQQELEGVRDEIWMHEFSQVNAGQNQKMIETVLEWSKSKIFDRYFDLYSGSGNFSFPLADLYPHSKGVAVELNPSSVKMAQVETSRRKWSRSRLQFFAGSVDAVLPRLPIDSKSLVVLDPPRAGLSNEVSALLSKTKAASIFYISCNPPTMTRDIQNLTKNSEWKLGRVQPFDMFPQTAHVEVLAELIPVDSGPTTQH